MAFTDGRPVWRVIHIAATAMMLVLAVVNIAIGQWFLGVGSAFIGAILLLARLPLFRLAVNREPDAIICRYVPWYEPAPFLAIGTLLVLGALGVAAAFRPDFSPVMGFLGAVLLVILPIAAAKFWRGYRRCRLRITPAALTVPNPARGYTEVTIPRERVVSVAPVTQSTGFGSTELVLSEITFQESGGAHTLRTGPAAADDTVWLTVQPTNLLAALQDWVSADPHDPGMLDRIEAQLRSRKGNSDPRRLAAIPAAVGPAGSPEAGPVSTAMPVQPLSSLPAPRRARKFSRGSLSFLLAVAALGAAYPLYRQAHRDPAPAPQTAEHAACPVAGASVVSLPKKSDMEPTIELPLLPGWANRDINNPRLADEPRLRGYVNNTSINEDDYPFLKVTLQKITKAGPATAEQVITKAREVFPTVIPSTGTVCGQTVHRFDISGYNPDGKGEQSGTTVFSVVYGKDGSGWIASAILKTKDPNNPAYIAQRDALAAGFHAGFP